MHGSSIAVVVVAGVASSLAGCTDRELPTRDPVVERVVDKVFPVTLNRDLDILFVVDDSGSMAGEQASLAASFPAFMSVLETIDGGLPSIHIGVVSTNVGAAGQASVPGCQGSGDDGNLLVRPACTGLAGSFISNVSDLRGERITNYTGELDELFACMAQLGTGGCGFEMPLESAYRALQPGANPGFLRPEAALAVVFITDEDDCSTQFGAMFGDPTADLGSPLGPRTSYRCFEFGVNCADGPADPRAFGTRTGCKANPDSPYLFKLDRYVDFLKGLKADPSLVVVAGVMGDVDADHTVVVGPDPANPAHPAVGKSCSLVDPADPNDGAAPPIRLAELLQQFPNRNTSTSICRPTHTDALATIADQIKITLGAPCMDAPLRDRNPALPGAQVECSVVDVHERPGFVREETVIAPCDGAPDVKPCWKLVADRALCPTAPGNFTLQVERIAAPRSFTSTHVQCVVD